MDTIKYREFQRKNSFFDVKSYSILDCGKLDNFQKKHPYNAVGKLSFRVVFSKEWGMSKDAFFFIFFNVKFSKSLKKLLDKVDN